MSLLDKLDKKNIPQHVAIIMDGNGRWAKSKGLDRVEGHKEGVKSLRKMVDSAIKAGVKQATVYAFSTENWNRPEDEVNSLMDLMIYVIAQEVEGLIKNGVRLQCIGDTERLPAKTREALHRCIKQTAGGEKITLAVAVSYSSRWELTEAAKAIAGDVKRGVLDENSITEKTIDKYLSTQSMPEVDLLIRTGGDVRVSNFMLWQIAYSEMYFTDVFWPDFDEDSFYEAILYFQQKERRFGKISEQLQ